jgi:dienelactone hydrolase
MKKLFIMMLVILPQVVSSQIVNDTIYQKKAIRDNLPSFSHEYSEQLTYPLSWVSGNFNSFDVWRTTAQAKVVNCLLTPPSAGVFHPVVIAEQDRGSYVARKIVFNITTESRVLGYLLVPKGTGPFPAVLLLHDHGAKFDIGKEKVVQPFNESPERITSAQEWVEKLYGGRFIGDELAKRGYVCFVTDALNWSDRGGAGYEGQQALASNLFNLGMSLAGVIAWEDLYSANFLASVPEVDSRRIIAMGLSMGSFRAWQLAALSDRIAGCVAVCWMGTRAGLLVPGSNLTRGQSSFTTTHPGLSNYLDYPDVASIACPKPVLMYNGNQDKLFPSSCVQDAYSKMQKVWESQNAGDKLVTKLWNAGHVFNLEMQDEAFQWLDRHFLKSTMK